MNDLDSRMYGTAETFSSIAYYQHVPHEYSSGRHAMIRSILHRPLRVVLLASIVGGPTGLAEAQDQTSPVPSRHERAEFRLQPRTFHRTARQAPADYRGLTINKRLPVPVPDESDDGENSATVDGPTRYGNVAAFDPDPYVDSGLQYPYGLDGVGGYGSDFGFRAGADTALYQRGP